MLVTDDLQVWINAFYNFPYFYNEFWNEINFKQVLEEISSAENFNLSILWMIS